MHKKSKEHYQMKKKERQTSDHCFITSRKLSQPTKKLDCPLALTVKNCCGYQNARSRKNT